MSSSALARAATATPAAATDEEGARDGSFHLPANVGNVVWGCLDPARPPRLRVPDGARVVIDTVSGARASIAKRAYDTRTALAA